MKEYEQKLDGENLEYMKRDEEGKLVPDYDSTIKIFDDGDIVSGKIIKIDRDEVLVDVGYKSEGVIPASELSVKANVDPHEIVSVGDEIEALVLQKEDVDGRLILSKKRADYEKAWDRIEKIARENGVVEGEVIEVVKGGLILDIGLRGFLPASLVDFRRVKELDQYIGKKLKCKIVEINRARNNVVLSHRAVLEESLSEERKKIISKLEKGQVLTGKISSIADFGAFVDLGGIDGLIHISELSWTRVNHPSEVVSIGDEVKVQVLDVDREKLRVSLGLKQTQEDPWRKIVENYSEGDIIEGKIDKIVPFGAFMEIENGVEGLIHISELSDERLDSPEDVVKVGQKVKARIMEIDLEKRRISLSLKQAEEEKTEDKKETKEEQLKRKLKEEAKEKLAKEREEELKKAEKVNKIKTKVEEAKIEEKEEVKEGEKTGLQAEGEEEGIPEADSLEEILEDLKKKKFGED